MKIPCIIFGHSKTMSIEFGENKDGVPFIKESYIYCERCGKRLTTGQFATGEPEANNDGP
jgi:hypothetical protein